MREHGLHRRQDVVGPEENVLGDGPDGCVPERGGSEVAGPIVLLGLPSLVKGLAVAFDDEPAVDDKIDSAYAVDAALNLYVRAETSEKEPHERLDARLTPRIEQTAQHRIAPRQPREHRRYALLIDQPMVPGTVQGGDRIAGGLTAACLSECLDDIGREGASRDR